MALDDATPQAAPADTGQPAPQAVPVVVPAPEAQAAPAADAAVTAPPTPTLEQELETVKKRYTDSSAEALRLYRENEALKAARPTAPAAAQPPTYSAEQLETWKEQRLVELAMAQASGDDTKVIEAAHQLRLIDAELRKGELNQFAGRQTAAQAFDRLKAQVAPIFEKHKADLQPGTPLYQEVMDLKNQAVASGRPDDEFTAASAVLMALALSGKLTAAEAAKASQEATKGLNQAIKGAAAAGSGAANANAAPGPDFTKMNPKTSEGQKAFAEYRKSLGVGT